MNAWKPVDRIADWLVDELSARAQLRLGVLLVVFSLPFLVYGFWTEEPFLVYQMSALALLLTGIGIVVGAEVLEQTENTGADVDDIHAATCPSCGK